MGLRPDVSAHVTTWLSDTQRLADREIVAIPEVLAALHAQFERIHPFLDGNGAPPR
jgi:Fic family protein